MTSPLGILSSCHSSASAPVKKKILRHPSTLAFNLAKSSLWCGVVRQLGQGCLTVQAPSTTLLFTSLTWLMEPLKSWSFNTRVSFPSRLALIPGFSLSCGRFFPPNSRSRLMTESSIIYRRRSCCMPVTPRWMIRSSRVVWVPWNEAAAPLCWSGCCCCCCCWLPFHFQGWAKNRKGKMEKKKH